jgi:hypothetical protein
MDTEIAVSCDLLYRLCAFLIHLLMLFAFETI